VEDTDFGVGAVPVWRDAVEDETKFAGVSGLEGGGGNGLDINIGVAGADPLEGVGLVLGNFVGKGAEKDLDGDGGDGAGAGIGDVSVDVGDFAAGEVGGLGHDKAGDGKAGRVGVERGGDGSDGHGFVSALKNEDDDGGKEHDDAGRDDERQPIAFARFSARNKFEISTSAHERILHPG